MTQRAILLGDHMLQRRRQPLEVYEDSIEKDMAKIESKLDLIEQKVGDLERKIEDFYRLLGLAAASSSFTCITIILASATYLVSRGS